MTAQSGAGTLMCVVQTPSSIRGQVGNSQKVGGQGAPSSTPGDLEQTCGSPVPSPPSTVSCVRADRFLSQTLSFLLHTVGDLVPASMECSQGILVMIPSLPSPDAIVGGSLVKWKSFSLADKDLVSGPTGPPNHCVP